jgi:hypothetical protein
MHEAASTQVRHVELILGRLATVTSHFIERHIGLVCSALCASSVAYFYLLDRILFSSAHFSAIFRVLLMAYDAKAAWLALALCVLATLWKRPSPILRFVDFIGRHPLGTALGSSAVLGIGTIVVYHNYPLSMDEYAAVFQSRTFASGSVVAHLPRELVDWLVVRGFNGSFLIASTETGRTIEAYWPGFALLLAPFQFLHVPWLCNASLSGLSIYLIHWITRQITDDRNAAAWAMLFTLASGAFIAEGISYYSMQAHLAMNLLYVALLVKPSRHRALAAGFVGSIALNLHNPIPHALFAIPWISAMATQNEWRRQLLPLILGYLPGVAVGLLWLGLRTDIGLSAHGLVAVDEIAAGTFAWPNATLLNVRAAAVVKMSIWAMPSVFLFALLGGLRFRRDSRARLLIWSAILTFAAYLFVKFDQGHGWGYRYFHSAWGVVPILAGCAMTDRSPENRRLTSFAGATAILSLLIMVPFQLSQIERFISAHLALVPAPKRPGNNIYFIHPLGGFYLADMVQFDPLLRSDDLLLVSHGADLDAKLVRSNWPSAVKVSSGPASDEWYLGAADQRQPIPGREKERQFVIVHTPP